MARSVEYHSQTDEAFPDNIFSQTDRSEFSQGSFIDQHQHPEMLIPTKTVPPIPHSLITEFRSGLIVDTRLLHHNYISEPQNRDR